MLESHHYVQYDTTMSYIQLLIVSHSRSNCLWSNGQPNIIQLVLMLQVTTAGEASWTAFLKVPVSVQLAQPEVPHCWWQPLYMTIDFIVHAAN